MSVSHLELIEKIRGKQGIHGLHIMPVGWEDVVPRIVTEADLLPKGFVKPETGKSPRVVNKVTILVNRIVTFSFCQGRAGLRVREYFRSMFLPPQPVGTYH